MMDDEVLLNSSLVWVASGFANIMLLLGVKELEGVATPAGRGCCMKYCPIGGVGLGFIRICNLAATLHWIQISSVS